MRIQQLDLLAFGPFTDVSLQFGSTEGALHLVYGPNEAGKSSALRALRYFLYGIPSRCQDAFIHPYESLRIGATITTNDGESQTLTRRKGRANTLRGVDDVTPVSDELLLQQLQGVDENTFRLRFGIDYESLTLGGRAIVEGGGDLAKSLFAAALGYRSIGPGSATLDSGGRESLQGSWREASNQRQLAALPGSAPRLARGQPG